MSGSTRSRQKRKLEPISLEELAGTTGMSGFCTFLTRDTSVPVPALDSIDSSAPDSGAPASAAAVLEPDQSSALELGEAVSTAVVSKALDIGAPVTRAPLTTYPTQTEPSFLSAALETSASDLAESEIDAAESSALESLLRRRPRIREASTVQDGHSLAEQAVYDAMYRAGRPYQGDSRILTVGLRTLAELSRMAYSNCKANVRSLVAKLAIDEKPGFSYTEGRTYIVYSFREILRRRKAAGLTHVIRTRGVAFVDPRNGHQLSALDSGAVQTPAPLTTASISKGSAPESAKTSAPAEAESSAPVPAAHIENRHFLKNSEEAASSAPSGVITALRRHIPDVDDEAAVELWRRCRENAPDARIDEVAWFIDAKAGKPGIRMPLGFLLAAVPKCFKGDSFRQFREDCERRRQSSNERERQFAAEILKSPDADEEQKQWARELLADPPR